MALQNAHWPINLSAHGSKTAHLVPVTSMLTTGQSKTAPHQCNNIDWMPVMNQLWMNLN
jgi:hypothetical protein